MGTQEVIWRVPAEPGSQPSASAAGASSPAGADPSRECLTPECHYSFGYDDSGPFGMNGPRKLIVEITFPFEIADWASGNAAITDAPAGMTPGSDADRLRMYGERAAERKRLSDLIHDQMEVVGADCFRVLLERDARTGEDKVDYGVRHARWRRTERRQRGKRPSPRDSDGGGEADEPVPGSAVGDSAGRETASPNTQVSETPSDTLGEKA